MTIHNESSSKRFVLFHAVPELGMVGKCHFIKGPIKEAFFACGGGRTGAEACGLPPSQCTGAPIWLNKMLVPCGLKMMILSLFEVFEVSRHS